MKIEIEGLPELPEGYVGMRWVCPKEGDLFLEPHGTWYKTIVSYSVSNFLIAIPAPPPEPWYPTSWRDAEGKLLPDVYEHDGGWPKHCEPKDMVEALTRFERDNQDYTCRIMRAGLWDWPASFVAYRVVERVKG